MVEFNNKALSLLERLSQYLISQQQTITCAESCTGGLIASLFTELAGSSAWFEAGFVTYSNAAKRSILGVSKLSLEQHSAVSELVACEMAKAALVHAKADLSIATTGYAGPTADDPQQLGVVWIAIADSRHRQAIKYQFKGNRQQVRQQAVIVALEMMLQHILEVN